MIDAAGNTELRYEIFERLNRGSMALNEQELRNCVFRGPFNQLLAELEKEPYWRKVKGSIDPEGRFKEREMILRVFAFANRLAQYTGNLKRVFIGCPQGFEPRYAGVSIYRRNSPRLSIPVGHARSPFLLTTFI